MAILQSALERELLKFDEKEVKEILLSYIRKKNVTQILSIS